MSQFPTPTIQADRPPYPLNQGVLTPNTAVSGVSIKEYGVGPIRQSQITLTNFVFNLTGGAAAFGGALLATFPQAAIAMLHAVMDLDIVATGGGNIQMSVGSTITADTTLSGSEVDMLSASSAGTATANVAKAAVSFHNGTTTPVPINLNYATASDPGSSKTLTANGTITLTWINGGDF